MATFVYRHQTQLRHNSKHETKHDSDDTRIKQDRWYTKHALETH